MTTPYIPDAICANEYFIFEYWRQRGLIVKRDFQGNTNETTGHEPPIYDMSFQQGNLYLSGKGIYRNQTLFLNPQSLILSFSTCGGHTVYTTTDQYVYLDSRELCKGRDSVVTEHLVYVLTITGKVLAYNYNGESVGFIGHGGVGNRLCLSPNRRWLSYGDTVYDTQTGESREFTIGYHPHYTIVSDNGTTMTLDRDNHLIFNGQDYIELPGYGHTICPCTIGFIVCYHFCVSRIFDHGGSLILTYPNELR